MLGISSSLCQCLLTMDDDTTDALDGSYQTIVCEDKENEDETNSLPFQGLPRQPYYKELGKRLCILSNLTHRSACSKTTKFLPLTMTSSETYFLVPANELGFHEQEPPTLESLPTIPNVPTIETLSDWLINGGDNAILRLLGMRQTIGTDPRNLLPPSQNVLLKVATLPHNKGKNTKLNVSARARAKHAHRGQEQFFGIASGSQEQQNQDTIKILINLLQTAVWINIHTFGGVHGTPYLEIRNVLGYGARWKLEEKDWSTTNNPTIKPTNVEFRGFLEPHCEDGHLKKWRH